MRGNLPAVSFRVCPRNGPFTPHQEIRCTPKEYRDTDCIRVWLVFLLLVMFDSCLGLLPCAIRIIGHSCVPSWSAVMHVKPVAWCSPRGMSGVVQCPQVCSSLEFVDALCVVRLVL